MTTTIAVGRSNGRLCNHIFRNMAVSSIAEKHDLLVVYASHQFVYMLGIKLYVGKRVFENKVPLTDDNYFAMLSADDISHNLEPNFDYFQTKEISTFLYKQIRGGMKPTIMQCNPFKERYNRNNDLFIHIRLGDVTHLNPGIQYYLSAISKIQFDHLHIASDSLTHPMIGEIVKLYPNTSLVKENEVRTIQFGSTCKHVILSHGSFSAIIGYMAFDSNIYYPQYDTGKIWHGDMFSIDGWNKIDW